MPGRDDDWISEWVDEERDDSFAELEEAIAYGDFEWDHRREYVYPTEEVAWLEWFSVERVGPVWQATCRSDGAVYAHPERARAIQSVRVHVESGHGTTNDLRPSYVLPTAPPF